MGIVLGITGGIASGKTTVTKMFRDLGAQTVSADDIARDVLAPGTDASVEVIRRFGPVVEGPDGNIDRRALGELVFRNPEAILLLNAITHPAIIAELENRIEKFRQHAKADSVLAVEIPLLVECDLGYLVDEVVVVAAEQQTQINRLTTRGLSINEAFERLSAQLPIERKLSLADWVIHTDTSLEDTREQVSRVWEQVRKSTT